MNLTEIWTGSKEQRDLIANKNRLDGKLRSGRKLTPKEQELYDLGHSAGRRLLLKRLGLGAGAAVAASAASVGFYTNIPEDPYKVIDSEIKRRGLVPSKDEMSLLDSLGYKTPAGRKMITDSDREEVIDRLEAGKKLLEKSVNPIFRNYWPVFDSLYMQGLLNLGIIESFKQSSGTISAGYRNDAKRGIYYTMTVSGNQVLQILNTAQIGFSWVHEIVHLKSMSEFFSSQDRSITNDELAEKYEKEKRTDEEKVKEEARAYAVQFEAYFHELGLGYRGGVTTGYTESTAKLIKENFNPASKGWLDYTEKNLMH